MTVEKKGILNIYLFVNYIYTSDCTRMCLYSYLIFWTLETLDINERILLPNFF